ncbi:MAG: DNA polymerase III subunit delta [Eubacteriales bacterium]|nr:DNA polymerase III subunit delta [Eubacteriales bacterium]
MQRMKEDIKNRSYHSAYLLYGEEDYLKRLYRDSLKNSVLDGSDEMNYSYYEGKDIDLLQVREIADTLPFFSDYRVVLLENSGLFKSANDLADYLPGMPDTTILIFVEKEIDKRNRLYKYVSKEGLAVEMKPMSSRDMKLWVTGELRSAGKQMKENTIEYLLSLIDNSMIHVQNELEKLIAYVGVRPEITREDVDAIASVQVTGQIFQMMDAVASGNKEQTMKLYHDLLEIRESPMSILYLLSRHFNILLQLKEVGGISKGEMAKAVGVPPFAVGRYLAQAKQFTSTKLREMLEQCIEMEYLFKRGRISDQIGVELLLVQFTGG